jgi:outer membrane receptor for monomeric catechols
MNAMAGNPPGKLKPIKKRQIDRPVGGRKEPEKRQISPNVSQTKYAGTGTKHISKRLDLSKPLGTQFRRSKSGKTRRTYVTLVGKKRVDGREYAMNSMVFDANELIDDFDQVLGILSNSYGISEITDIYITRIE